MPGGGRRGCACCRRDQVADLALAAEGSLPGPVTGAAVSAAAPAAQAVWRLAQVLAADPAALSAGAPPVAGKLAAGLIARGPVTLAVPRCARCGRTGKPLFTSDAGGACQRCRAWQLAASCSTCGKVKPAAVRAEAGKPLCEACRRRTGRASRRCGTCGKTAPTAVRARDGRAGTCVNCCKMPEAACPACGRRRECNFAAASHPACPSCSPEATATCARCGQDRPPRARRAEGPVCDPCCTAALKHRGQCASCGRQRRLVTPAGTCADCAGLPVTSACTGCRTEDKLCERGRCGRCGLRQRAAALPAGPGGVIPAVLRPVFEAICAARVPEPALSWLRRSHGAALLAGLAVGKLPAAREALDADPRRRAAGFLRQMLTASGVLPPRGRELARTGQWAQGIIGSVQPAASQRAVRAYAAWQVMRRLRATAGRTARPRACTARAHRNIRAAVSFLAWLHGRGRALAGCRQAGTGAWLAASPAACQVRDFLSWAIAHGHCHDFTLPGRVRASGTAASQEQRWELAARLLHDGTLDLTGRAAGCLVLLCGQPLSRIAAMTTSQVTSHSDTVHTCLGDHDIPVPEPLGIVLAKLIRTGRTHTGTGSPAASRWLFPGGLPGQPVTPGRLGGRLRALGICTQTGRRAALPGLAAQLPAAVLAGLPGLAPATAVKWMHQAGGDWSRYAAGLARTPHHQP